MDWTLILHLTASHLELAQLTLGHKQCLCEVRIFSIFVKKIWTECEFCTDRRTVRWMDKMIPIYPQICLRGYNNLNAT